jgi:hypothetical protein
MTDAISIEQLSESMYGLLKETAGGKKLSANDLTKMMVERYGASGCSRDACKQAIRRLIDSGRCTYTYFGGTYVEIAEPQQADA